MINKNSNQCKINSTEKSKLYNEARRVTDATTLQCCCFCTDNSALPYILHIQEDDLRIGDSRENAMETTISLREEGARVSENWFVNWKTGINLCISYKQNLANWLLIYWRTTILFSPPHLLVTISGKWNGYNFNGALALVTVHSVARCDMHVVSTKSQSVHLLYLKQSATYFGINS